jgi:hypothetical protein
MNGGLNGMNGYEEYYEKLTNYHHNDLFGYPSSSSLEDPNWTDDILQINRKTMDPPPGFNMKYLNMEVSYDLTIIN